MRLTPVSRSELRVLRDFIDNAFGQQIFKKITAVFQIYKSVASKTSYTLLDKNNNTLIEIAQLFDTYYSAGCPLLESSEGELSFNVGSIPVLAQFTDHKVKITSKAIELFLYGRDIFKKSIIKFEKPIEKNSYAIIVDEKDRAYGIGELLYSSNEIKNLHENMVVIKNILDIGFYLRSEDKILKTGEISNNSGD
ncbi:MAG: hypothetical protein OdinLCB4_002420 [Candidatus Odinarchaeum yellowstonii]|uniref:PUA domain-containing protein n=1 Tax=Odinarchaeota yellowstonii (strain LCB_4) TaxID=1841599 RepID=A0AAF0D328_ODILC|nr:MAG: hypothetical protein OdinLCB4_002420 [Candidatus Odinarchaeum yellowstonii]